MVGTLRVSRERRVVRKRGFEPRWYCYRQPLKLVRLPVPPLPRCTNYCAGVAGAGAGFAAAGGGAAVPLTTDPDPRWPMIDSISANSMKSTAATEVALVRSV